MHHGVRAPGPPGFARGQHAACAGLAERPSNERCGRCARLCRTASRESAGRVCAVSRCSELHWLRHLALRAAGAQRLQHEARRRSAEEAARCETDDLFARGARYSSALRFRQQLSCDGARPHPACAWAGIREVHRREIRCAAQDAGGACMRAQRALHVYRGAGVAPALSQGVDVRLLKWCEVTLNRRFESDAKPALRACFRAPQPER